MTIAELISKLQRFPPCANINAIVIPSGINLADYEGGDTEWIRILDVVSDPADNGDTSVVVQYHDAESDPLHFFARS